MLEPICNRATVCGGCPLIDTTPAEARAIGETRVRMALQQSLGTRAQAISMQWATLPQPIGYRRRIRLRISEQASIEFFNPGKYRQCPVLTPRLRQALSDLYERTQPNRRALQYLHHLELREPDLDGVASAYFVKRAPERALPTEVVLELERMLDGWLWAVAKDTAQVPAQRLALPRAWQYVPIGSFLQVNHAINTRLVSDLMVGVRDRGLSTFCDLYAGSGNFTLPLLATGLVGPSVESDADAIVAARLAATLQSLPSQGFTSADAGPFAAEAVSRGQRFDVVVVDPPRAGVKRELSAMAALAAKYLVYCSCNPTTLARDLDLLCADRFELESMTLYDMFPYTEHVESLVWLRAVNRAIG